MKFLNCIALTLVIVGALNWLLVGLFEFNLVDANASNKDGLVPPTSWPFIYSLVGLAGIWSIAFYSKISD